MQGNFSILRKASIHAREKRKASVQFEDDTEAVEDYNIHNVLQGLRYSVSLESLDEAVAEEHLRKIALVSNVAAINEMLQEVELTEEKTKCAVSEARKAGNDILVEVEELKEKIPLALENNNKLAGEVFANKSILATEAQELQTRLLNISEERNNLVLTIEEMRKTLERRRAAAELKRAAAEKEKIEREESIRKTLEEQKQLLEVAKESSEMLEQQAQENTKRRKLLTVRGHTVDALHGEMLEIFDSITQLKLRVDNSDAVEDYNIHNAPQVTVSYPIDSNANEDLCTHGHEEAFDDTSAPLGFDTENKFTVENECSGLKDRIGSLPHGNECIHGLLADKGEEIKHISSMDAKTEIAQLSLPEPKLLNLVEKLRDELEDLRIERELNNLLGSSIFKEMFLNYQELLIEKDVQRHNINEDQRLEHENDQLVSVAGSTLMQHHEQVILVNDERTRFMKKVCEQGQLILELKSECNSMQNSLYELLQQIHEYKEENHRLNEKLSYMSIAFNEAKAPVQCIDCHMGLTGHLEFDPPNLEKLSIYLESRVAETTNRNETRLTQIYPLEQHIAVLKKKEIWYRQMLEIKCSNLLKAEVEVDILGDEVDTLLGVLGRIYIVLDHYSPVMKHYRGVMDIFRLVQKVLKAKNLAPCHSRDKS